MHESNFLEISQYSLCKSITTISDQSSTSTFDHPTWTHIFLLNMIIARLAYFHTFLLYYLKSPSHMENLSRVYSLYSKISPTSRGCLEILQIKRPLFIHCATKFK
jgi:hypothetical protein